MPEKIHELPYVWKKKLLALESGEFNNVSLDNVLSINMADPTELTISAGAITKTQGYHTVDTQSDDASDDLDTINGGAVGDMLTLAGANDAREVVITRAGNIRFQPEHMLEVFTFSSPTGASGTFYAGGFYTAPAAHAALTQASATQTYVTALSPHGTHAFAVASGAGTVGAGGSTISIVVSGTNTSGAGDSEVLVADVTAMTTNKYYQTTKSWVGVVTYTLTKTGGTSATYAATFNYGKAAYDSFDGRSHTIKLIECMGRAGANDTGFDIQLIHHKATGWTYSAAAFAPGTTAIASLVGDYGTNNDLVINERFKWEKEISTTIAGTTGEGFLVKVITSANKAVEFMNISIYAEVIPDDHHLKNTNQAIQLIHNGTYWMMV
jgi:hypothetical protein